MIEPGTRVGPYEVIALIGSGGMGEVYRARDPRVDRTVAIKFVSAEFRGRFEREGRAIAALNHPNVCQLYDVGPDYLVMEFVEGAPLGPVESMRKLLDLAAQIADGLAAAHAAGVIHRDLKPANILVTGERSEHPHRVKILDFGVASMRGSAETDAAHETRLQEQTSAGTILGTVAYMSPEQARGTAALTAQSDQFSLGIVLTELATGKHPFMRDSAPETLTAIIREDPPPLPAHVPTPLRWVIERLLAKEPQGRYESTRDLHRELQQLRDRISEIVPATTTTGAPTHSQPAGQTTPKKGAPLKAGWIVAASAAVALTAGWAISGWLGTRATDTNPIDRPLMRVSVELAQVEYARPTFALSPDGAHVAFLAQDAAGRHLAIQSLSRPEPTVVQGSEDADNPFFSPDSRWVGFTANGKLFKVPLEGGPPVSIANAAIITGASWGDGGTIVAPIGSPANAPTQTSLAMLAESGGPSRALTPLEGNETTHRWPQVLPGGEHVLYTAHNLLDAFDDAKIRVVSIKGGPAKTVIESGYFGRFLPSGHLLYVHGGTLYGVRFDPAALETRGTPVALVSDLAVSTAWGVAQFDVSRTGSLLYRRRAVNAWQWRWMTKDGETRPLLSRTGSYYTPRFSPDGSALAFSSGTIAQSSVMVYEWQRDKLTPVTTDVNSHFGPVWAPDGKHVIYRSQSASTGEFSLDWARADGGGSTRQLLTSKFPLMPGSISPSGRLIYTQGEKGYDIWTLPLDLSDSDNPKAGDPEPYLKTAANELQPVFSPDGRWVAYVSNADQGRNVYVRPFPIATQAPDRRWIVSPGGGDFPVWSRTGQLFYTTTFAPQLHSVEVRYKVDGDTFVAEKPTLSSPAEYMGLDLFRNVDVSPDGQRFVVASETGADVVTSARSHLTLLLNFGDEIRRRLP